MKSRLLLCRTQERLDMKKLRLKVKFRRRGVEECVFETGEIPMLSPRYEKVPQTGERWTDSEAENRRRVKRKWMIMRKVTFLCLKMLPSLIEHIKRESRYLQLFTRIHHPEYMTVFVKCVVEQQALKRLVPPDARRVPGFCIFVVSRRQHTKPRCR